jgi:hypothetical protein
VNPQFIASCYDFSWCLTGDLFTASFFPLFSHISNFFLVSTLWNSNYDIIYNPSSFQCKILSCQTVKCKYPIYSSDVNNETCM